MDNNVIYVTSLASKIREVFDKDTIEGAMINAKRNLENQNESIYILLRKIDTFMENDFFINYFKSLVTCIDLNYCKEYEYEGDNTILYSFKIPVGTGNKDLLIYELDIGLSYLYQRIQEPTYKEIINKILKKYNFRAINHSAICVSQTKTYEITIDIILLKGPLYDYMIDVKEKFLKGEVGYEDESNKDGLPSD